MKHTLGLVIWSGTPNGANEFRVAGVAAMRGAAEANARLIAAAPDMLEALQLAADALCDLPLMDPRIVAIRAAIAKAVTA